MKSFILDTRTENLTPGKALFVFSVDQIVSVNLYFNSQPQEPLIEIRTTAATANSVVLKSDKKTATERIEHLTSLFSKIYKNIYGDKKLDTLLASEKFGL